MMWIRIAIFVAIIGALQGAVGYAMGYSTTDWFHGEASRMDFNNSQPTQEQIDALSPKESDSIDGGLSSSFSAFGFLWSTLKGIFLLPSELGKYFFVENPENPSENLFAPFLWIIQLGIWIIYALGLYQLYTKQQIGYGHF